MKLSKLQIDAKLAELSPEDQVRWLAAEFEDTYPQMINSRPSLKTYVEQMTRDMTSDGSKYKMSTKLFWIFSGIKSWKDPRAKCKECGAELHGKNVGSLKATDYPRFCCSSCQVKNSETQAAKRQTSLERYGVDHPFKSEVVKARARATNKREYGAEWFIGSEVGREQTKKTKFRKYGDATYVNPKKRASTSLERTGYSSPFSDPRVIKKMVAKKKATGDYGNHKKTVATRKHLNHGPYQSPEQLKKAQETSMRNFGVPNPMQSEAVKETLKKSNLESFWYEWPGQCPEIQEKQRSRYTWNGINFDSAPELAFYIWHRDHNIEFMYQPRDRKFEYVVDGEKHFYYPDFKVGETYYELKGDHFFKEDGTMWNPFKKSSRGDEEHWIKTCQRMEAKRQCMIANGVVILKSADYKLYLDYVKEKYGASYLKSFKRSKNIS